jgi:hypothetical protein
MEISKATEWYDVRTELTRQVMGLPEHNPQFSLLLNNISTMVSGLSKLEAEYRNKPNHWSIRKQLTEINQAIDMVEKYILIAILEQ